MITGVLRADAGLRSVFVKIVNDRIERCKQPERQVRDGANGAPIWKKETDMPTLRSEGPYLGDIG